MAKVRGIKDLELFLNPKPDVVHNPMLLKNIKQATERVMHAVDKSELITLTTDP